MAKRPAGRASRLGVLLSADAARAEGVPVSEPVRVAVEVPDELVDVIAAEVERRVLERLAEREPVSEFVNVEEAADMLRAKPQRVHDLTSAGVLRRYKDGSRTLISRRELLEYLTGDGCPSVAHARGRQRSNGRAT